MLIDIDDVWTAVNKGWEQIAMLQLKIAKRSSFSGDITINDRDQLACMKLYANIYALGELNIGHSKDQNLIISKLYNNIKLITKDIRRWD